MCGGGGGWSLDYGYFFSLVVFGCSRCLDERVMVGFGFEIVFRCCSAD